MRTKILHLLVLAIAVAGLSAPSDAMGRSRAAGVVRPAASEFGLGPRISGAGLYVVTLEPTEPLRPRRMQTVRLTIRDDEGRAVVGAEIAVDGGMPEHGHGLPTRPRMTANPGDGVYEIDGVRFNMGGWWELRLAITSPRGVDSVTFNLDL